MSLLNADLVDILAFKLFFNIKHYKNCHRMQKVLLAAKSFIIFSHKVSCQKILDKLGINV